LNIDEDIWATVIDYPPQMAAHNAADDIRYVVGNLKLDDIKRQILKRALEVLEGISENV
jgi:hypothetical protein